MVRSALGSLIESSALQSSNVHAPIDLMLSFISMVRSDMQLLNVQRSISLTLVGRYTESRFSQLLKAKERIFCTPSLIITLRRLLQRLKMPSSITLMLLGISTCVRPVHPSKACGCISFIVVGMVILFSSVQPKKAMKSILSSPYVRSSKGTRSGNTMSPT